MPGPAPPPRAVCDPARPPDGAGQITIEWSGGNSRDPSVEGSGLSELHGRSALELLWHQIAAGRGRIDSEARRQNIPINETNALPGGPHASVGRRGGPLGSDWS